MIPKTIHYCWFGRNPKPKLAKKCIKSWKKHCPDYQIIEWNEDNFDVAAAPIYVQQAYQAKKWAFVTDYVRLYAMVNYGGIYMDTDVEVIKKLDPFLGHKAFSGFEDSIHIPTGIMGCEKDYPLFVELLQDYHDRTFLQSDGTYDLTTNVILITEYCKHKGFTPNNQYQVIDGFALYPNDVFCPFNLSNLRLEKTQNTVTIHWFAGSWFDTKIRKKRHKDRKEQKRKDTIDRIVHLPNRVAIKLLGQERYDRLKKRLKG